MHRFLLLAFLVLFVAGCGGSSDDASGGGGEGGGDAAKAAEPDGSSDRPFVVSVNDEEGWVEVPVPDEVPARDSSGEGEADIEWTYITLRNDETVDVELNDAVKDLDVEEFPCDEDSDGTCELRLIYVACSPYNSFVENSVEGGAQCGEESASYNDDEYMLSEFGGRWDDQQINVGKDISIVSAVVATCGDCDASTITGDFPKSGRIRFEAATAD